MDFVNFLWEDAYNDGKDGIIDEDFLASFAIHDEQTKSIQKQLEGMLNDEQKKIFADYVSEIEMACLGWQERSFQTGFRFGYDRAFDVFKQILFLAKKGLFK